MKILVAAASRHGATFEIAERIGSRLRSAGHDVDVVRLPDSVEVSGYGAVVLGSAVYMGRWLEAARELVQLNHQALSLRPTWLFSSGPIGDPPKPGEEPVEVGELAAKVRAVGHRVFAGVLDRQRLGFAEKAVVRALRAPEGDFRDWVEIDAWATRIAEQVA